MDDAPMLSLSLLDDDAAAFGQLDDVSPQPVNVLAYEPGFAALSDGLISMSLLDDEPLPQRIAG